MRLDKSASRFLRTLERAGLGTGAPSLGLAVERCATVPAITKIDHVTFVTTPELKQSFIERWEDRGFKHHGEWHTSQYAASHTALVNGACEAYPWAEMVGLTVKTGSNAPLDRTVDPAVGVEQAQHVAFNVDASADASALYSLQQRLGFEMMTPVLSYSNETGAGLKQWFTRPVDGFFIEFAQRLPDAHGEPFGGFHPETIEDLYQALDHEHHIEDRAEGLGEAFGHAFQRDEQLQVRWPVIW
eukprot:CAMPEP_0206162626 /NCGR_PEP_ID=MMETSP1474-20131121/10346_1 /ASSEMBLY_ACC=CAM_ASM_001110 /TAXON_ID=97495 /ORGANISM="Imantonia sp., Strain RCC918" /LENGTH=242 /DNA_ID=CAMNT_0053564961 /DNA_START=31 /DNA_END=759 /DNA_ORIENTATION=-